MLFFLYRAGIFLTEILPMKACYGIAEALARAYYFMFSKKDKIALSENLRMVIGRDIDAKELDAQVLKVFINFAKHLVDFFKFQKLTEEQMRGCVEIKGRHYLDEARSRGKGVILLAAHLGSWELGGAAVAALGYPVNAIVLEHKDKRINDYFVGQRSKNNVRGIPIGMQVKQCFRVLKSGEMLAIVADKDYSGSNEWVEFFGEKTYMPKGAAVIGLKTGAPIIITSMIRKKDDTFCLRFEKQIPCEGTGNRDNDVRKIMRRYLERIETHIKEYPDQWYAFERLWKRKRITQ
ncbi:MAG: lysophospholipid acyltransferase family protein [Candidatus Omnitrophica bacterium]|nr:lysophospholipid acyltransferase family protein [Candidatus Omnitrophota bacterium]MBU1128677.1 lysophospholipid acyltransferase family protein [Candidatus Omnitrophota bacterium]MBU1785167.1 lysophospholipid acyltransferase family protein [Candidatus Omnitrophota bacterium]MBU1852193.1 lysophospholipid acyltransferase family protein [Candidatus Omnitrophota bacterium]